MPTFRYEAITEPGELVRGEMDAFNEGAVVERLRGLGYTPIRAEPLTGVSAAPRRASPSRTPRIGSRDVIAIVRGLATLLRARLTVDQALNVLVEFSTESAQTRYLSGVRDSVRGGASLSRALASQGRSFDEFCVGLVRAGEASGSIDAALTKAAEYLERRREWTQKFRSAMLYPSILLVSIAISLIVIFVVVVPSFQTVFEDAGVELPLVTSILFQIGDIVQSVWWVPVLIAALAVPVFLRLRNTPQFQEAWDARLLRIPVAGPIYADLEIARMTFTLGMLLQNGVRLPNALELTRQTIGNTTIRNAVGDMQKRVREGKSFASLLRNHDFFPPLLARLVKIGEEGGHLDAMLLSASETYETEVSTRTQRLLTLITPAITFVMAIVIGAIIFSILLPMLSLQDLVL